MTTLTRPFDVDRSLRQTALLMNDGNEVKTQEWLESKEGKLFKDLYDRTFGDVSFTFTTPGVAEIKEHDRKVAQKDKALKSFLRSQTLLEEKIADGSVDLDEATERLIRLEDHIRKIDKSSRDLVTGVMVEYLESVTGYKDIEPDQKFTHEFIVSDAVPQAMFWMIYQEIRDAGLASDGPEVKN